MKETETIMTAEELYQLYEKIIEENGLSIEDGD
jgi:hypothetical protein